MREIEAYTKKMDIKRERNESHLKGRVWDIFIIFI